MVRTKYCIMDASTGQFLSGNNVGVIRDGVIYFNSLAALIIDGGNAGVSHLAYLDITIQ